MRRRKFRKYLIQLVRFIPPAMAVGAFASAFASAARAALVDTWTGATNGNWDTSTANWSNGGSNVYTDGDAVQFPDTGAANLTVTVQAAGVSPASVSFTDAGAGTNAYTFNGGAINGGGAVSLNSGFGGSVRFNVANGYTGGTTVSGGTLTVANNGALGTGSLTLNGGTLNNAAAVALANSIVVSGTGNAVQTASANNLNLNGGLSGSGSLTLGNAGNNNSVFVNVTNTMTGGTITLANNTNSVRFQTGSAGNAAVAWVFNNTGANKDTLDFTTGTIAFGSMTGGGTIQGNNSTGTKTISAGALGQTDLFSGTITNGAGTLALTKVGTGPMTLSGSDNYTGNTTVAAGTLALSSSTSNNNIGSSAKILAGDTASHAAAILDVTGVTAAGGFKLGANQTLAGFGTVNGATTVTSTSKVTGGDGTTPGLLTTGGQTWAGGGMYLVNMSSTASGLTTPGSAQLSQSAGYSQLSLTSLSVTATAGNTFTVSLSGSPTDFVPSNTYTWTVALVTGSHPVDTTGLVLDTSGFHPSNTPTGSFSLSFASDPNTSGASDLNVTYTQSAPEPASFALALTAALPLVLRRPRPRARGQRR